MRAASSSTTPPVLHEALELHHAGISTIPILANGSKAPAIKWEKNQEVLATPEQLQRDHRNGYGLAAVCGAVSGNLECLDIDEPSLIDPWLELAEQQGGADLVGQLVRVNRPSGGAHFWYRHTSAPEGNTKLAKEMRPDGKEGKDKPYTLIETRGEGGYAIIPPSPAACHPENRPYEYRHGTLAHVATITAEEREILLDAARSLNKVIEPSRVDSSASAAGRQPGLQGQRPGDDYNENGPAWKDILAPHGWEFVREQGGVAYWRRPGKSVGVSATVN